MSYIPPKRKSISKNTRDKVFKKYNGHCAYCGVEIALKDMQVDHLIPMEMYEAYQAIGQDIDCIENYMPACRSCNHYKSTLSIERFRKMLERQPDILMRDSVTYRIAVRFGTVIPNQKKIVFYFEKERENI